ncbi:MAG: regulatory iron-sulfur-containing complex subunit RicT [Thermodesulfovibrionales bacterium]|nr:regulatory iron-sulfur-containing complex subunit RicT [Thermodesulfovibrionales bacterium]
MPDIAGIRFQPCGKIYDFDSSGIELKKGDTVIVESDLGLSIGRVVSARHEEAEPEKKLKPVLRKATEEDMATKSENKAVEEEARAFCLERIMARGLPMKLVCTDVTLDRRRFMFYFVANTRIDFRELVKDLAARFRTRIELRQIGVRDESKLIGGFGVCGREVCCRRFLTTFEPISIKLAKQQELVLNTSKLSGTCGRLMCCLNYEAGYEKEEYRRPKKKIEEEPAQPPLEEAQPPVKEAQPHREEARTSMPSMRVRRPEKRKHPVYKKPEAPRKQAEAAAAPPSDVPSEGEKPSAETVAKKRRRRRRWRGQKEN